MDELFRELENETKLGFAELKEHVESRRRVEEELSSGLTKSAQQRLTEVNQRVCQS